MFAFSTLLRFGFKPAAGHAPRVESEWTLSSEHSLLMQVRRGDTLRVDRGTVWIGADVTSDLVELHEGNLHTARCDAVLRLTGIDAPRLTVLSQGMLKVSTRADYGGWRHQPPIVRAGRSRWRWALA